VISDKELFIKVNMLIQTLIVARVYRNKTMRSFIIKNGSQEFWIARIGEYDDSCRTISPSIEDGWLWNEEISAPVAFVGKKSAQYKKIYAKEWQDSDAIRLGPASWQDDDSTKESVFSHEWRGIRSDSGEACLVLSLPTNATPKSYVVSSGFREISSEDITCNYDAVNDCFVLLALVYSPRVVVKIDVRFSMDEELFMQRKKEISEGLKSSSFLTPEYINEILPESGCLPWKVSFSTYVLSLVLVLYCVSVNVGSTQRI
jgi:hypothetical protein